MVKMGRCPRLTLARESELLGATVKRRPIFNVKDSGKATEED